MQNDFMNRIGKLYVPGSEEIKENIKNLAIKMNKKATKVFYTMDWHTKDDEELSTTPDFVNTFPEHCMAHTDGVWLIPQATGLDDGDLALKDPMPSNVSIFKKNRFSVFVGNNKFLCVLNKIAYFDSIYIAGVSGDVCVKHAIDGLIEHKGKEFDFKTLYIIEDCIASINSDKFEQYMDDLYYKYEFVKFRKVNEIEE